MLDPIVAEDLPTEAQLEGVHRQLDELLDSGSPFDPFSGGATGRVCRIDGDEIYVAELVHTYTNLPGIGETIVGGSGGAGTTASVRVVGSSQAKLDKTTDTGPV